MKNKELFIESLKTLLYSWGGDTPSEAIWAANELLDWAEQEYNIKFEYKFLEIDEHYDWEKIHPGESWDDLIWDEIENKL